MTNVLIAGGTGFVGHWMQQTQPEEIKSRAYLDHKQYNWRRFHWDAIVHLAPIAPTEYLEFANKYNTRLLYCSSGIVYHPENNTEYRMNKIMGEQECLNSGVDVVIARLFTFCGERLDDNKAITQFEKAAKNGEPLRIWGDGNAVRSYMHGSELGKWMWAILLRGQSGEAYDVGSDEPITLLDLAKRYSDNIIIENSRPDPMPVYLPMDTAKTRKLLNNMVK